MCNSSDNSTHMAERNGTMTDKWDRDRKDDRNHGQTNNNFIWNDRYIQNSNGLFQISAPIFARFQTFG